MTHILSFRVSSQGEKVKLYPVHGRLTLNQNRAYVVEAAFDKQLMDLTVAYWEGIITVRDWPNQRLIGRGYLELTGY